MTGSTGIEKWMQRALDIARRGKGQVSPNPLVGAVLVHQNRLISEGYHTFFGGPHAEVNAVGSVPDQVVLSECALFVTLEPCSHHGKTPPCTELIIQSGIKEVYVAMEDPNPLVCGRGIDTLRDSGIKVHVGILELAARELNRPFILNQMEGRPYYLAKWAMTADAFMGRLPGDGGSPQISNTLSAHWVHKLRSEVDAILIGSGTAIADNPLLSNRLWPGKNPIRVLLDRDNLCPSNLNMFEDGQPLILFRTKASADIPGHVEQIILNPDVDMYQQIDLHLKNRNLMYVLVEGGRLTLQKLIDSGRMDEAWVIRNAKMYWKKGIEAPYPVSYSMMRFRLGGDELTRFIKPSFAE